MRAPREILISLESRLENLGLVGSAVHGLGLEAGLDEAECAQLELCVVEGVTNSIRHSYDGQPGRQVRLHVLVYEDRLELRLMDSGRPMAPGLLERPEPEVPENPADLPEGGRGLFILRRFSDEVAYTSDASGNVLTVVKKLRPSDLKTPS